MKPIAKLVTMMIPKWIGSTPSAVTTGNRMGARIMMAHTVSMKQPTNSSSRLSSSRRQIPSRLERPAPLHLKIGQGTDSSQGPPMSGYASSRRARSVRGQGDFSARYPMSSRHADFTQEAMAGLERYRMESARYHFQGLVLPTSVLRVRFLGSPSVNNEDDVSLQSQYIPQECLLNAQAQALEKEQAPEVSFSKLMSMVHIDDMIKTQAATNSVDNSARVSSRRATAASSTSSVRSSPIRSTSNGLHRLTRP